MVLMFSSYPQPAMMASFLVTVSLILGRQTGPMVSDQTASSASLMRAMSALKFGSDGLSS